MTARNHFYSTSLSGWLDDWLMALDASKDYYLHGFSSSLSAYQAARRGADLCLQLKLRVCCWSIIGTERCAAG
jgi:hypothetical protein